MRFVSEVNDVPCIVKVLTYCPATPMRITGTGFGDAEPPEPAEFDFILLHEDGTPAPELLEFVTSQTEQRLLAEFLAERCEYSYC